MSTLPNRKSAGMPLAEVIDRAKQGDEECFKALYDLHKRRVYSICRRMIGNVETAEDLTQDAFLLLHRKLATFRGDSAFSTWLHRLTVNIVLMYLRKGRLSEVSLDDTLDPTQETGAQRDYGIEDLSLSGSIDRITLERAIESLPPGCRITFVLHDIEGYEHNEIAEVLGCSVGNSKSQLHKARIKLRGVLYESRALHTARTDNAQQGTPQTGTIRSLEIPTGRQNRAAASAA